MNKGNQLRRCALAITTLLFTVWVGHTQNTTVSNEDGKGELRDNSAVLLWEPVDVPSRDLLIGPAANLQPEFKNVKYIGRQDGGNSLKHRIKDGNGVEWVAKVGRESRPELAATRLLWAVGYRTETDFMVQKFNVDKIGSYSNVRLEARPDHIKRLDRWSWGNNPFVGTKELDGLKIMMAIINNWDLKDENTIVVKDGDKNYYVVGDLGASFGKLADKDHSRTGRSVGDPEDYAKAPFVKGVHNGIIEFHYNGIQQDLMKGIKVENARWLADILMQLSDQQIEDAFRAANYKPEEVQIYAAAVKARIKALDDAAKEAAVAEN